MKLVSSHYLIFVLAGALLAPDESRANAYCQDAVKRAEENRDRICPNTRAFDAAFKLGVLESCIDLTNLNWISPRCELGEEIVASHRSENAGKGARRRVNGQDAGFTSSNYQYLYAGDRAAQSRQKISGFRGRLEAGLEKAHKSLAKIKSAAQSTPEDSPQRKLAENAVTEMGKKGERGAELLRWLDRKIAQLDQTDRAMDDLGGRTGGSGDRMEDFGSAYGRRDFDTEFSGGHYGGGSDYDANPFGFNDGMEGIVNAFAPEETTPQPQQFTGETVVRAPTVEIAAANEEFLFPKSAVSIDVDAAEAKVPTSPIEEYIHNPPTAVVTTQIAAEVVPPGGTDAGVPPPTPVYVIAGPMQTAEPAPVASPTPAAVPTQLAAVTPAESGTESGTDFSTVPPAEAANTLDTVVAAATKTATLIDPFDFLMGSDANTGSASRVADSFVDRLNEINAGKGLGDANVGDFADAVAALQSEGAGAVGDVASADADAPDTEKPAPDETKEGEEVKVLAEKIEAAGPEVLATVEADPLRALASRERAKEESDAILAEMGIPTGGPPAFELTGEIPPVSAVTLIALDTHHPASIFHALAATVLPEGEEAPAEDEVETTVPTAAHEKISAPAEPAKAAPKPAQPPGPGALAWMQAAAEPASGP